MQADYRFLNKLQLCHTPRKDWSTPFTFQLCQGLLSLPPGVRLQTDPELLNTSAPTLTQEYCRQTVQERRECAIASAASPGAQAFAHVEVKTQFSPGVVNVHRANTSLAVVPESYEDLGNAKRCAGQ